MTNTEATPWSAESRQQDIERVNRELAEKGGGRVTIEESVDYHDSNQIWLPLNPAKMSYAEGSQYLAKLAEDMEEMYEYTENFMCRPPDGALAFNQVLKNRYGITAIGKAITGWGGTQLPTLKTVQVAPPLWNQAHTKVIRRAESVQVPWGVMDFPPLKAQFQMFARPASNYGPAFSVRVVAKKSHAASIQGVFEDVKEYLEEHSIYRHKSLEGLGTDIDHDGFWAPAFLDAYAEDRSEIVYSSKVYRDLHHGLWGRIKAYDLLKEDGVIFNPKILLHGENGTGKTAAALITAQICLENGMGFIQAQLGEDLEMVVNFASHVGHPMVVAVEDSRGELVGSNGEKFEQILNLFDGTNNKGREVGLLLCTNHAEKLPADLLRTRRINRTIYVSDLDADALHRLINIRIPAAQREELDYEELQNALEGFKPSSVVQVLEDARVASVIRTGKRGEPLTTEDFVVEAEALRPQLELHRKALEHEPSKDLETVFRATVREEVSTELSNRMVDLEDGEIMVRS
jgi:hypothetical protein